MNRSLLEAANHQMPATIQTIQDKLKIVIIDYVLKFIKIVVVWNINYFLLSTILTFLVFLLDVAQINYGVVHILYNAKK